MKVLIVGPAWPLRGGLATFDERLCLAFKQEGHDCEIVSFSLQYPEFLFPGKTQFSSDNAPLDVIIYPALNSINPFNWIIQGLKFRRRKYDLVVFRYWMPFMGPCLGTFGRMLKVFSKTRIVAITDNLIPHEKRPGDRLFTKYFAGTCHGMVSMSESVLHEIRRHFPNKKSGYNPHPMYDTFEPLVSKDEALRFLKLHSDFKYILFFGFIRKYKGLDTLIKAMAHPGLKNENIKAIVAGEFYESQEPYLKLVSDLQVEDKIVFHSDFIPNSQVHYYFSAADVVVQPYHSATQSGVTQIAFYYDLPMIVTDVGGLSELVPHGKAGYIAKTNADDVAQYIIKYFSENKKDEFSAGVREHKKIFTWPSLINTLINTSHE